MIKTGQLKFEYKFLDNDDNVVSQVVLEDINLHIEKGQFVAIVGANGSGKSTLSKTFNALLLPKEGVVLTNGMNTKDAELTFDIRKSCGIVFQNPDNQIIATIVEEDIAFGLENLGIEREEMKRRIEDVLDKVQMTEYRNQEPHMLSGGQKQRIAIAGVLAMKPKCIVFDEATAMLDPIGRREVMKVIKQLQQEDITIVLITHFMEEVIEADKVIVLNKGKIVKDGTPREVFCDVELLNDAHLEVPQITEICHKLRAKGIDIKTDILTIEELIGEINCLKEKNK